MALDPSTPQQQTYKRRRITRLHEESEEARQSAGGGRLPGKGTEEEEEIVKPTTAPPAPAPSSPLLQRRNLTSLLNSASKFRDGIEGLIYRVGRLRGRDPSVNGRQQQVGGEEGTTSRPPPTTMRDTEGVMKRGMKRGRSPGDAVEGEVEGRSSKVQMNGGGRKRTRYPDPQTHATQPHGRKRGRSSDSSSPADLDQTPRAGKRLRTLGSTEDPLVGREDGEHHHNLANNAGEEEVEYEDISAEVQERLRRKREAALLRQRLEEEERERERTRRRKRYADECSEPDDDAFKEAFASPTKKVRVWREDGGDGGLRSPGKRGAEDEMSGRPIKKMRSRSATPSGSQGLAGRKRSVSACTTDTESVATEEEDGDEGRRKRARGLGMGVISE